MIEYGSSHLSLGVLIGLPVWILTTIALVGVTIWLFRHDWDDYDKPYARVFSWIGVGLVGLSVFLMALGYYPYGAKYHNWQHIGGDVTSTNSRFLAKSGGTDQKFVVTFKGSPVQYGCNDTRCSTVRVGDRLTLTCKAVFQWFGTDGWDCNFINYSEKK